MLAIVSQEAAFRRATLTAMICEDDRTFSGRSQVNIHCDITKYGTDFNKASYCILVETVLMLPGTRQSCYLRNFWLNYCETTCCRRRSATNSKRCTRLLQVAGKHGGCCKRSVSYLVQRINKAQALIVLLLNIEGRATAYKPKACTIHTAINILRIH